MPSFIPRDLEPYKKRDQLRKRLRQLHGLVVADAPFPQITAAAEKARAAALALAKSKRALLAERIVAAQGGNENRETDDAIRLQLGNLEKEEATWTALSVQQIIQQAEVVLGGRQ